MKHPFGLLAFILALPLLSGFDLGNVSLASSSATIDKPQETQIQQNGTVIPLKVEQQLSGAELFDLKSLYSSLSEYQYYHASSYDLDGGNLDGLYFYKHESIAATTTMLDVNGPGVMTSFWAGGYSDQVAKEVFHFYVDGSLLFAASYSDLFSGRVAPFIKPYVGADNESGGGCYFYTPIVFQKSLKITAEYLNYYNIDYCLLPSDMKVHSTVLSEGLVIPSIFTSTPRLEDRCSGNIHNGQKATLYSGKETTLLDESGSGIVEGFTLAVDGISDASIKPSSISPNGRWVKAGGSLSFAMDVRPDNVGCYLKYRIDAIWSNQVVKIYCDGAFVSTVDSGNSSSDYRIRDLIVALPSGLTSGKSNITIKIECISVQGIDFPFFDAWMYSVVSGGSICTDYLDISNGSSETAHAFVIVDQNGSGTVNSALSDPAFAVDLANYPFQTINALPSISTGSYSNVIAMNLSVSGSNPVKLVSQVASKDNTTANVWVDGKKIGAWSAYYDGSDKISETSFIIPVEQLAGKTSIVLSLVPISGSNNIAALRCYEKTTLVDAITFANDQTHGVSGTFTYNNVAINGVNSLSDAWGKTYQELQNACDYNSLVLDSVLSVYTSDNPIADFSLPLSILFNMGVYGFSVVNGYSQGMNANGLGYFYLPMPYQNGIRITLSRDSGVNVPLSFLFSYAASASSSDTAMTLKAQRNSGVSSLDYPLPWLNATGSGKLVGLQYNCTGASSFAFLEGDEIITIDGSPSPICNGTGTEDIFESAWYFVSGKFSQGLHGLTWKDYYGTSQARVSAYRSYLTDQIVYHNGIKASIEHGPNNNTSGETYCITAFYYSCEKSDLHSLGTYSASGDKPDCTIVSGNAIDDHIDGHLEGNSLDVGVTSSMRLLQGTSEFHLAIPSNNQGILIRRLFDLRSTNQRARVYCDGNLVNEWTNKDFRGTKDIVRYEDFIIPASFTAGKNVVTISFATSTGAIWEESQYQCFSLGTDFDPIFASPDTDGDGIKDLADPETIVKGIGLDLVFSYCAIPSVQVFRRMSTLTGQEKAAVTALLPGRKIVDSFDIEFTKDGADYESQDGMKVRYQSGDDKVSYLAYFDSYGSLSLLASHSTDGFTLFGVHRGGKCLALA